METPIIIKEEHPFTRAKMPKMPCSNHRDYYYHTICKLPTCLCILCPICIEGHNKDHLEYVKPLELCLSEAYTALAQEANRIVTKDYSFSDFNQIKTEVYRVVEQYFEGIQQQIKQFSSQSQGEIANWKSIISKLHLLSTPDQAIHQLREIYQGQSLQDASRHASVIKLQINHDVVRLINAQLYSLIKIVKMPSMDSSPYNETIIHVPCSVDTVIKVPLQRYSFMDDGSPDVRPPKVPAVAIMNPQKKQGYQGNENRLSILKDRQKSQLNSQTLQDHSDIQMTPKRKVIKSEVNPYQEPEPMVIQPVRSTHHPLLNRSIHKIGCRNPIFTPQRTASIKKFLHD